jgi:hypothetical protein
MADSLPLKSHYTANWTAFSYVSMVLSDIEGTEIELKTNRQEVLKLKKWIVID